VNARRAAVGAGLVAAAAARASYETLLRTPIAGSERARRRNFRGTPLDLLGGPAAVVGSVAALAFARVPRSVRGGALVAVVGAGLWGAFDDVAGDSGSRGLRGHLGAVLQGRPTTGAAKIVGIGVSGLIGGALVTDGGLADALPAGLAIAVAANVGNLFDLRPGRAAKVAILTGVPLMARRGAAGQLAGAAVGAAVGLLGPDLGERTMLGDTGANTLGALLGLAAVAGAPRRRSWLVLAALASLTAASEVVSFSAVIERHRALRYADRLGRLADA
jgi:UDP-GlcNAc:undecaprenyl-phosphate/decaprenyl-phosphate GlcNAc-1-phosphate transferase